MNIQLLDPTALRPHPVLKQLPLRDKDDEALIPIADHIRDHGLPAPLRVTAEGQIVDLESHDLWLAAKRYPQVTVPCQIVDDLAVFETCALGIMRGRTLTKGAKAYLIWPLLGHCQAESRARSLANLQKGKNPNVSPMSAEQTSGVSLRKFAEKYGIGKDMFTQAEQLHAIFARAATDRAVWLEKNPSFDENHPDCPADLRADWEIKILDETHPIGLGAVIVGINGQKLTKGMTRYESQELGLFLKGWKMVSLRAVYWQELTPREREELIEKIEPCVEAIPDDLWRRLEKARKHATRTISE